jgi:hypothetical protein
MKLRIPVVSVALAAVVLSGATIAQTNDWFSAGACCTPVAGTSLPAFPGVTFGGRGASIADCGVEAQWGTAASLTPVQVLPDYWLIGIDIDAQPAFSVTNQTLAAKYARTWIEYPSGGGGAPLQVWRFLVNGDLVYSPGPGATESTVPKSALPPFNMPVHFVGNVDFALDLGTANWEVAYTLSHFCPQESHAWFSRRPIPEANLWVNRTYHFVGPANFQFDGVAGSPSGLIVGESARRSTGLVSGGPYAVLSESGVHRGLVSDISYECVGGPGSSSANAPRYAHQWLGACSEFCPGGAIAPVASLPIGLPTLPTGFRGLGLGVYVPAAGSQYPGQEYLSVYLGVLDSAGVCASPGSPSVHAVTGVGTAGGHPVVLFDAPLPLFMPLKAIDLHDMNVLTPTGFVPGFGALFGSERVWSITML